MGNEAVLKDRRIPSEDPLDDAVDMLISLSTRKGRGKIRKPTKQDMDRKFKMELDDDNRPSVKEVPSS